MGRKRSIEIKKPFEAAQEMITAYDKSAGKPVSTTSFSQNRAREMSRKGDKTKDFYVGLQDLDSAIIYYFDHTIKPYVFQEGDMVKVPITYSSPERWKSIQNEGFLRDTNNMVKVPIIVFRRTNIEKNRTLGNKIDGNKAHLFQVFETKYNSRNHYDRFSILTNKEPSKQYYVSVIPDYITATYECIIFTNYVEQNNKIIEAIEFASDSYWGDPKRFQFRAKIDSFASTISVEADGNRIAKTTFTITLNGYIIPDSINKELANSDMFYSTSQVVFGLETTTGDAEEVQTIGLRANAGGGTSFVEGSNNVSIYQVSVANSDLEYLQTNNTRVASTVTSNTATFTGISILYPPQGSAIPNPTLSNFTFTANGIFIPAAAIISFEDVGNDCVLTIDPTILEYAFTPTYQIVVIGKVT
jgi:hypothetical protein